MSRRLTNDDVMRLLTAANPNPPSPPETVQVDPAREALLAQITATPPATRAPARSRFTRSLRARVTALIAALAATLAAVFATAPATAADILREAAAAVAAIPLGDGQYWHIKAEVQYPGEPAFTFESWHSGTTYLQRSERTAALDAADTGGNLDPDLIRVREVRDQNGNTPGFGSELQLTRSQLAMLPTTTEALRTQFLTHLGHLPHGEDHALWHATVGLLWSAPLTPAQRHAAWELLATSQNISLLGTQEDGTGRTGQAIEADWTGRRLGAQTILIDIATGTLLEVRDHDNDGMLTHRTTILDAGTSTHAPAPQPPVCGPDSADRGTC